MKKLNKYISDAGYCSRRQADEYIVQGRVTINSEDAPVGASVSDDDIVEVDGERVGRKPKRATYIAFNKPRGIASSTDPNEKENIASLLNYKERIFPAVRLDKDAEGLMILTNDGDAAHKIARAAASDPAEYAVTVDKPITGEFIAQMSGGVRVSGGMTRPARVTKKSEIAFHISIAETMERQIRRMCYTLGYKASKVKCVRLLNISLKGLESGDWRYLSAEETAELLRLLESVPAQRPKADRPTGPKAGSFAAYRSRGKSRNSTDEGSKRGASYGDRKAGATAAHTGNKSHAKPSPRGKSGRGR